MALARFAKPLHYAPNIMAEPAKVSYLSGENWRILPRRAAN